MPTKDLGKFGSREIVLAMDILKAIQKQGYPDKFEPRGIEIQFNQDSGFVFLVNEDFQVAMLNEDDELAMWWTCPDCGFEGFSATFYKRKMPCCIQYFKCV